MFNPTPDVGNCYGAPMGRPDQPRASDLPHPKLSRFQLARIRINRGGYDRGGVYWGIGKPLYSYSAEDDGVAVYGYFRAKSREDAKAHVHTIYPEAKFYR